MWPKVIGAFQCWQPPLLNGKEGAVRLYCRRRSVALMAVPSTVENLLDFSISVERASGNHRVIMTSSMDQSVKREITQKSASLSKSKISHQYVLTLIGAQTFMTLEMAISYLMQCGSLITSSKRLCRSESMSACEIYFEMDTSRRGELEILLRKLTDTTQVDAVLQMDQIHRRIKRLAIFDLDSTLIQMETADTIAKHVNKSKEVEMITTRAMNGELEFGESLKQRVELLEGVPLDALEAIKANIPYTAGVKRLMRVLSNLGCTTCVCSGGFTFLTDHVRKELGMDASFSNILGTEDGKLTGSVEGTVVDAQKKMDILITLRTFLQVAPEQVLAVGDGANDLPMLGEAGLGVAFNARARVQDIAKTRMNQNSMDTILYLLGLSDEDIEHLDY